MREIQYKGRCLPIHFGMKSINEFTKRQNGVDFNDAVTTTRTLTDLDAIVALAAQGLNEGARKSGTQERYTEDDVWDMLDDQPSLVLEISEIFMEAIIPLTEKLGSLNPNPKPTAAQKASV